MVDQEGFQGLAEVLDEMEAIDHLHGLGRPPANAIGVEVAPIATDHADRRMLGQPGRDARGRAVRQQVHDAMSPRDRPGWCHTDGPAARPTHRRRRPAGLEWAGIGAARTRRSRVAGLVGSRRRAASRAPAFPPRATPIARRAVTSRWVLRRIGATRSGRRSVKIRRAQVAIAADEFPDRELEADGARPPGEVRQVALIATMDGR